MTTTQHSAVESNRLRTDGSAFVVGGGRVGQRVANELTEAGETVTFVDRSPPTDPPPEQRVETVDTLDGAALDAVGFGDATAVLVLEPDDATNLLVAQLARSRFDVDNVLVRVNDPERVPAFDDVAVETVEATEALVAAVTERW